MRCCWSVSAALLAIGSLTVGAAEPQTFLVAEANDVNVRHSEGTLVALKDGSLLLAWIEFQKGEGGAGGSDFYPAHIVAKTSSDGGLTWGNYRVLAEPAADERSTFSPNLLRLKNGDILFVFMRQKLGQTGSGSHSRLSTSVAMISRDEGQTFDPLATAVNAKPIIVCNHTLKQLDSGRILLPLCRDVSQKGERDHWKVGIAYSDDDGKTWTQSESWLDGPMRGLMEPHVEEIGAGRVLMVMRTQAGSVWKSFSADSGQSWTTADSLGVEAPESCPDLLRIPGSSDLLLVWNAAPYDPKWASHFGKRTPLSTAISKDGGTTWSAPRHLESDPGLAFSNPAACFINADTLYVTYWTSAYNAKGFYAGYPIHLKAAIADKRWLYGSP